MKKRSAKIVRAFVSILAAVAMLVLIPGAGTMKVSAAEPITFAVKYLPEIGEWRFQANTSTFDAGKYHRELYYLRQMLQEGDLVVVYNDSTSTKELDLGKVHLNNLTIAGCKTFTIIYSGPVDNCYVLRDSSCSINADVTNAFVYDTSLCNISGDVKEMNLYYYNNEVKSTLGCSGKVDHLYVKAADSASVRWDLYNFTAGTLNIQSGVLKTSEHYYTKSPAPVAPEVALTAKNFDYTRYANDYPDLKAAFGYDAAKLYNHYVTCGKAEGRKAYAAAGSAAAMPENANFDYIRYADDYPDLKAAFGYDAAKLYNHYVTCGMREGRMAYGISSSSSDFDYTRYANDYPDLKAAFGYDAAKLYNHYITCGMREGRVAYSVSGSIR